MPRLSTLRPSISSLSEADQLAWHERIRESRLTSKAPVTKAAAKRRETKKEVSKALRNITPEQAVALLKKLNGG